MFPATCSASPLPLRHCFVCFLEVLEARDGRKKSHFVKSNVAIPPFNGSISDLGASIPPLQNRKKKKPLNTSDFRSEFSFSTAMVPCLEQPNGNVTLPSGFFSFHRGLRFLKKCVSLSCIVVSICVAIFHFDSGSHSLYRSCIWPRTLVVLPFRRHAGQEAIDSTDDR